MKKIILLLTASFLISLSGCKSAHSSTQLPKDTVPKVVFSTFDFAKSNFPKQGSEVNDFEFMFSLEEIEELTKTIRKFEKETGNQIAIVSIKSIGNYSEFDKYALDLSNNWRVGQYGKDNGLTIVFSNTLKRIRISTGTGAEKILTDKICKEILNTIILPEFKNGHYYDGIKRGLSQLIMEWK